MGNCASTMRIIDSIELGLDGGVIKIEGKKKTDRSLAGGDCGSGVFNRVFLSRYGVANQVNSATLQDTTLDEIFNLKSKLDQGQTRTSTANLLNVQANSFDGKSVGNSPSPRHQRKRYTDDDVNTSSFEALILDLDEVTPYNTLRVGRRSAQQDVNDFEFSVLPSAEPGCYRNNKSSSHPNLSPQSSHNSLRLVTRQNSEEPARYGGPPVQATPRLRSHLAIHKHDPINTSTGSSTSGVEISSLSSRSELLPNGASLPRMYSSSTRLLYQPSYDPEDFLSPEDIENPLFIYRSLSFRRAIEEGSSSSQCPRGGGTPHLSFIAAPLQCNAARQQRTLRDCHQQDASYFHVSQDSGHAQSLSLGSSLSIDGGGRFQGHLPSQSPLPLTDDLSRGAAASKVSVCYRPSLDPFGGSQDESSGDRFVWKSFTSEDSGFDPNQVLGTDLVPDSAADDPFCRNHLAVELRVSPGRRRCLSTLTEEELTEAMSSGPYQPTHPFPFPTLSSSRGVGSHQPLTSDAPKRPPTETKHLPAPLAVTISTGKRIVATPSDQEVHIAEQTKRPETHLPASAVAKVSDVASASASSAAENVARGIDTTQAKSATLAGGGEGGRKEDGAVEPMERTSILIRAKRKSLHEMRHLQKITAAEEPLAECEEGQQTTKTTTKTTSQRVATGNDDNGCSNSSSDKPHQMVEESSCFRGDDPSDEPFSSPFPSLTDELLQKTTSKDDTRNSDNPEELSLQESEEKFSSLALAFKTDRETLDKRIELHLRARDVAEQNIQKELESIKDGIKVLNQSCGSNPSAPQIFAKIQTHFDVLEKSITRMSSRAEVHGAVQQELRVSQAIETMLEHVENLKRTYQTEHQELQEARKSLNDGSQDGTETAGATRAVDRASFGASGPGKGSLRRISLALMAKSPKLLLRNTSLQMSDSFYLSSSTPTGLPPVHSRNNMSSFSNDYLENSCTDDAGGIASRTSSQLSQLNRRYSATARNGAAEDLARKRRTIGSGVSNGRGSTSREDGSMDMSLEQKPDSALDQKRELLRRILFWFVAMLQRLLQRSSKASIRDGLSFMLGTISKFHPRKILSPGVIAILMFVVSAAVLLFIIWNRWRI